MRFAAIALGFLLAAPTAAEPHLALRLVPEFHAIPVGGSVNWHLLAELNDPTGTILATVSDIAFSIDFGFGENPAVNISNNAFQPAFDSTFFGPANDGTVVNDSIIGASGTNSLPPLNNPGGPDSSNPLLIYSFTMTHNPEIGEGIFTPQLTIEGQMTGAYVGAPFPNVFFYQRADGTPEVSFSVTTGTVIIPAPATGTLALLGLTALRRHRRMTLA